jgi:LacI family transcriptional regulator
VFLLLLLAFPAREALCSGFAIRASKFIDYRLFNKIQPGREKVVQSGKQGVVTIADVAERAKVSKTTVSHVLSGKRPVAASTRQRIEHVIEELGFRPNTLARNLRMQRTQMIALIIPDITNPYYPMLARGLQDALVEQGYHAFLCNTDGDKEQEIAFIADAVQRKVDGIIVSSLHERTQDLVEFIEEGVTFVSLGPCIEHPAVDRVSTDDQQGALHATRYLIQHGHQRIGMIGGVPHLTPSKERFAGYCKALEEAHIPFYATLFAEGDFMRAGGVRAMRKLMAQSELPTAIFCANDLMAIGAMDVARELGIRIPEDIAIVGYDDIEVASLVSPALTTVLNPGYDMGKTAGRLLLERLQGKYTGPGRHIIVPYRFIQRESA